MPEDQGAKPESHDAGEIAKSAASAESAESAESAGLAASMSIEGAQGGARIGSAQTGCDAGPADRSETQFRAARYSALGLRRSAWCRPSVPRKLIQILPADSRLIVGRRPASSDGDRSDVIEVAVD